MFVDQRLVGYGVQDEYLTGDPKLFPGYFEQFCYFFTTTKRNVLELAQIKIQSLELRIEVLEELMQNVE